jgi:hypothetical protein
MKSLAFAFTCVVVSLIPLFQGGSKGIEKRPTYAFINSFQGAGLHPVPMKKAEKDFYSGFPGQTGYYSIDGRPGESLFLRYTEQPTRMLHSAEGCYKASGFEIEFTDNVVLQVAELGNDPIEWSQFRSVDRQNHFLVRQCVLSLSTGRSYSDIPAWYWQTNFTSDDPGPWLAVTWRLPETE